MPCVYWQEGDRCSKFTDDECDSFCVLGPCSAMRPSNADRIRAMSDEELAYRLAINECGICHLREKCFSNDPMIDCEDMWLDWLKQEVEE